MTNFTLDVKELNKFLEQFKKSKEDIEKELSKIDEKYRKLAEKEKKELNVAMKKCDKEIAFWENTVITRYADDNLSAEAEETASVVEEDVVVDNAPEFDGAGFTEADNVSPTEETPVPEEPVEEELSVDENAFEPAGSVVEEINVPELMEAAKNAETPFPDSLEEEVITEEATEVVENAGDDWQEFKDVWN